IVAGRVDEECGRAGRVGLRSISQVIHMMKGKLALVLCPIMLLGTPLYAQSLCSQCIKAAQDELKKCLDEAISQEDKKSCFEKQDKRTKTCEDGECKIERMQRSSEGNTPQEKK